MVYLTSAGTGISCDGEDHAHTAEHQFLECVVLHTGYILFAKLLHSLDGLGTLHCELADLVRCVIEFLTGSKPELGSDGAEVIPVLLHVGGIDYEQICLAVNAVCEKIVHDTALAVGEAVILHLSGIEKRRVIGRDILYECKGVGAFYPYLTHVRHIEYSDSVPDRIVFLSDTYILNRHIVSGERNHLGTQSYVLLGKCCCFHLY